MGEQLDLKAARKPGRPRAIPERLLPAVFSLYDGGLGYRAIARELKGKGLSANWSTVRQAVKNHQVGPVHKALAAEL